TVPEDCVLQNVPDIGDVEQMAQVLRSLGASVDWAGQHVLHINAAKLHSSSPAMEYAGTLRGSFLVMGALLGRLGEASCPQPGGGTHTVEIEGVESLRGCEFEIIPDRLEAGTYAVASALTQGEVEVRGACPEHLESLTHKLREAGVQIEIQGNTVWARGVPELRPLTIEALPYPGLATDLQALVAVLLTQAHGVSYIHERVLDNRLLYAGELRKMGA